MILGGFEPPTSVLQTYALPAATASDTKQQNAHSANIYCHKNPLMEYVYQIFHEGVCFKLISRSAPETLLVAE